MDSLPTGEELPAFTIYLYRRFIPLRNIVEKWRDGTAEFDSYDYDYLKPIYAAFLEERRKSGT